MWPLWALLSCLTCGTARAAIAVHVQQPLKNERQNLYSVASPTISTATEPTTSTTTTTKVPVYAAKRDGDEIRIQRDGKDCLLARFHGRLRLPAPEKCMSIDGLAARGQPMEPLLEFPQTAVVDGRCEATEALLEMNWFNFQLAMRFETKVVKEAEAAKIGISSSSMWELASIALICTHDKRRHIFVSNFSSVGVSPIKAPQHQGFVCRDSLSFPLSTPNGTGKATFMDIAAQMLFRPFDVPANAFGFGNTFVCRRTRAKIGLQELRTKSTVAMSVVFAFACVATVIGYAVRHHYFPPKTAYQEFADE